MEQLVRVVQVFPDGTAKVLRVRESACSGDCHKCSGCGAQQQTLQLTAENPIGARPGETVRLHSSTAAVLKAAAVVYLLPLVLVIGGYLLAMPYGFGPVAGIAAFLAGAVLAVIYDRRVAKRKKTVHTIVGYPDGDVLENLEKGDNHLD